MKKKGFTLVEMLGILVVLTIIVVISVPAITSSLKKANQQKYDNWLENLYIAAEEYVESHREDFYEVNAGATSYLSIQQLIDQGYLEESIKDPETGEDITDVAVIKITVNDDQTLKYELTYLSDLDELAISVSMSPDPNVENWTSSDVTVTIYAATSPGVRADEFSFDGGNTWQTENKKSFSTNQTVKVMARDSRFDRRSQMREVTIRHIDKTKPSASKPVINLVTTKSITVRADCQDAESGIRGYQFSSDNGATWTSEQSNSSYKFDNLETGTYQIKAQCINGAGLKKASEAVSQNTKILGVPTCTISPSSGWTKEKTIQLTYPEGDANNKFIYSYQLLSGKGTVDGDSIPTKKWLTTTKLVQDVIVTSADDGTMASVVARVSDGVNTVSGSTCTVTQMDGTPPEQPTVKLKLNNSSGKDYNSGSWTNQNVYHEITSTDVGEGVAKYQYSNNNANWIDVPTTWPSYSLKDGKLTYVINWDNDTDFYIRAVDKAGNVSKASKVFSVQIDKTKPTCAGGTQNTTAWGVIGRDSRYRVEKCSDNAGTVNSGCVQSEYNSNSANNNVEVSATIADKAGNTTTCKGTIVNLESQLAVTSHNCAIGSMGNVSKCQLNFNTTAGLVIKHVYWQLYNKPTYEHQGGYSIWSTNYEGGLYYNGVLVRLGVNIFSGQSLYVDCTSGYCNGRSLQNVYLSICSARNWNNCVDEFGPIYMY